MRSGSEYGKEPGNEEMRINGIEYKKGDRVRLKLGKRTSAADLLLDGKIATIETMYTENDDKVYFAVTIDDDPAQEMNRELNIYRYFLADEVELISGEM